MGHTVPISHTYTKKYCNEDGKILEDFLNTAVKILISANEGGDETYLLTTPMVLSFSIRVF